MKIFSLLCLVPIFLCANNFTPYKNCYKNNKFFYDTFLSTDFELNDVAKLHLYALRFLIDIRLEEMEEVRKDSDKLFEFSQKNIYLYEEYKRKYLIVE